MEINNHRVGGKPEKKKPQLNLGVVGGGGGGLGGLVLLGGGLAVAALVAAFTVFKNKNTRRDDQREEPTSTTNDDNEQREASRGLSFVLHTPLETTVNQNSCCTSNEASTVGVTVTQIDSCELVSTHNLVLEDKPVPILIGDGSENPGSSNQEILLSDNSSEESITSSYDIVGTEEFSPPMLLDEAENVVENESEESFQFIETIEVKKKNEAADAEVLEREENLSMQSIEEEVAGGGGGDVNDENVREKDEEKSEGKFAVEENSPMQEILLSDDSDQESIASGDDILCTEDSSLAVPIGPSLDEPENMINNDCGESLQFTETIGVIKENEAVSTDKLAVEENSPVQSIEDHEHNSREEQVIEKEEGMSEGKLAVEEDLLMQTAEKAEEETEDDSSEEEHAPEIVEDGSQEQLAAKDKSTTQQLEEEEEDDDDEREDDDDDGVDSSEEVTEEEEDSSEGTGSSSMESNVEAIWPAEMIDAPPQELKERNVNYQDTGDKIMDEDRIAKAGNHDFVDCQSDGKNDSDDSDSDNESTELSRMMLNNKAAQELVPVNDQMVHSPKWRIWIWSILLLLVLLLLLVNVHGMAILQDLSYHDYVIAP